MLKEKKEVVSFNGLITLHIEDHQMLSVEEQERGGLAFKDGCGEGQLNQTDLRSSPLSAT